MARDIDEPRQVTRTGRRGRVPPERPTKLGRRAWSGVLSRTDQGFRTDELTDRAAGLTYYAVLSIFPTLLALVSVLGLLGSVVVSLMLAILYWAAPNVRHPSFRWITPGSIVAVIVWIVASAAFALYVTNFGSYNKTYGALAGVVVFLVWLWISNIAVLLGVELDAELQRGRAIEAGHPAHVEPYAEPRDTRKFPEERA
jgi:uncharacterized BrkB/YihY/UPF0761 family membrane protein